MATVTAQRRLVKSPPELWAEVSVPEALGRHLEAFGPIRIIRTSPETTVAWEGEAARGTVELEASGWGTRVTLTADRTAQEDPPETVEPPAPQAVEPPAPQAVEPPPPQAEGAPPPEVAHPSGADEDAGASDPPARPGPLARLIAWVRGGDPGTAEERDPPGGEDRGSVAGAPVAGEPAAGGPAADAPPEDAPPHEPPPAEAAAEEAPPQEEPPPEAAAPPEPEVAAELAGLEAALDSLGQAHHRPFSRG